MRMPWTAPPPPGSIASDIDLVRRRGFPAFVRLAFSHVETVPYVDGWHVDLICKNLDDVLSGRTRRLVINVPPGMMKSILVSVLWPVYQWILDPTRKVFSISHDGALSMEHARRSRDLITSSWFQARWSHVRVDPGAAAGDYQNSRGGWRKSTSIGGNMVGLHASVAIIDDPHKPNDVGKAALEAGKDFFMRVLPTRFADQTKSQTVIVMQRLHEVDMSSLALEDGYKHLRLPMRYEPDHACKGDIRTEDGELLWPERFPLHEVERVEKSMGAMTTAAQYQQRPVPEGGAILRAENLQRVWTKMPSGFGRSCVSVDCTFSARPSSDYVSITAWGRKGADFLLLGEVHERLNVKGTCDAIKGVLKQFPFIRKVLVEKAANGEAVLEALRSSGVPGVEGITPGGTSKMGRIQAVAPLFESNNVVLPASMPTLAEFRHELISFPGRYDDRVDSTSMALSYLSKGGLGYPSGEQWRAFGEWDLGPGFSNWE